MIGLPLQLAGRNGRDERVGVDLAVGVRERDAHLDAPVLEFEDVVHVGAFAEFDVAVGPDSRDEIEPRQRQRAERRRWVLGEDHDLAGAAARPCRHAERRRAVRGGDERRKQILEHGDFPRARGELGRVERVGGHGQRVELGRRQERPVLPVARVGNPLAPEWMPAEMAVRLALLARGAGRVRQAGPGLVGVEHQPAPVGLREDVFLHGVRTATETGSRRR